VPLGVVLCLVILKYVPGTDDWQLARLAGIVSFGYAAFLALRLIQGEEAIRVDGWSELRASPVEVFGALGGAGASALLMTAVIFNGALIGATPAQVVVAFLASVALAAASAIILYTSIMVRVRWNQTGVERRDAQGRVLSIAWADVTSVKGKWTGITITAADKRKVSFSPLQSGAGQLAVFAQKRALRNVKTPAPAAWG
jgi:hypothetical protein